MHQHTVYHWKNANLIFINTTVHQDYNVVCAPWPATYLTMVHASTLLLSNLAQLCRAAMWPDYTMFWQGAVKLQVSAMVPASGLDRYAQRHINMLALRSRLERGHCPRPGSGHNGAAGRGLERVCECSCGNAPPGANAASMAHQRGTKLYETEARGEKELIHILKEHNPSFTSSSGKMDRCAPGRARTPSVPEINHVAYARSGQTSTEKCSTRFACRQLP